MADRPVLTFNYVKPTIAELEEILEQAPGSIEIQPDGSVKTVDGEPQHANPEVVPLAEVLDITPAHEPIGIARQMVKHAIGAKAGLYVLMGDDDKLSWDMAGHCRKDLLWALERMKQELMMSDD